MSEIKFTVSAVAKSFKSSSPNHELDVRIKNKDGKTEGRWSGKLSDITLDAAESLAIELPDLIQKITTEGKRPSADK